MKGEEAGRVIRSRTFLALFRKDFATSKNKGSIFRTPSIVLTRIGPDAAKSNKENVHLEIYSKKQEKDRD